MKLTEFIKEMDVVNEWPISKATLQRARKRGLPFYRIGAFVCYRPKDLEDFFCIARGTGSRRNKRLNERLPDGSVTRTISEVGT